MSERGIETVQAIAFDAPRSVRAAIARLGRTEDVQFSPDGRHLALPGLNTNRLLILDLEIELSGNRPKIAVTRFLELQSPSFSAPHGVAWADPGTLLVANRTGNLAVIEIPCDRRSASVEVQAIRIIGGDGGDLVKTPGSVLVRRVGMGLIELFVCNNYVDHVTRHLLDARAAHAVIASQILIGDGITVPDGIAQTRSGRCIAISNHDHQNVLVLRDDELRAPDGPEGVLSGICYPHGLSFSADGRRLLVADAGAPCVRIYSSDDGNWTGARDPERSIRVLSDAQFRRGNHTPREGGPKGLALNRDNSLMVISCECQPLAFFDMRGLLDPPQSSQDPGEEAGEAEHVRATLVRYLSAARDMAQQEAEAVRRAAEYDRQALVSRQHEIQTLLASRSWRLTAPLRSLNAAVQRLRRPR